LGNANSDRLNQSIKQKGMLCIPFCWD